MCDINKVVLTGTIVHPIKIVDDSKGKRAAFVMKTHAGFKKGVYNNPEEQYQHFRCICMDDAVETIKALSEQPVKVGIEGTIRTRSVTKDNGQVVQVFEIMVSDSYAIGARP